MLISCNCSVTDYVISGVSFTDMRRARKPHKCGECHRTIEPGETYEDCRQLFDYGWDRYKTCLGCKNIRDHLCPHGWYWGSVAEQVEACVGFNYVTEEP